MHGKKLHQICSNEAGSDIFVERGGRRGAGETGAEDCGGVGSGDAGIEE